MNTYKLQAEKRVAHGSNANKKIRKEELVPAVLYQKDEENVNLQVVAKDLDKVVAEAGTSAIVTLSFDGTEKKVIIRDYQRHPFKNMFLHVDFLGVNMNETLKVSIPVVLLNRDEVIVQPSVLMQGLNELEIEALPSDIPAQIEFDVQNLQIGDVVTVSELEIPEGVTVLNDAEEMIASLSEPKEELDEEIEDVDAADVEVIGEESDEEAEESE